MITKWTMTVEAIDRCLTRYRREERQLGRALSQQPVPNEVQLERWLRVTEMIERLLQRRVYAVAIGPSSERRDGGTSFSPPTASAPS